MSHATSRTASLPAASTPGPDPSWVERTQRRIASAAASGAVLDIVGGGTRGDAGGPVLGEPLGTGDHRGIVSYEPSDLIVTVRAGTPLAALDAALAANHQMLGFEPPQRAGCTVGGAVALGWSGPRRPFAGALRDHLLGVRLLDGLGRDLRFGGPVVKNVAGFDVARLMAGSMGILGVLLEVSLRVVPRPVVERTGVIACDPAQALRILQGLRVGPGLLSGAAHAEGRLLLRSSGTPECVLELLERLGAQPLPQEQGEAFWQAFNDQTHMFFVPADEGLRLWRLSVRLDAPALPGPWRQAADWAGALRWVWAPPDAAASLAAWARGHGGHAALWRGATPDERQSGRHIDLPGALRSVHERLADVFDPHHVFNRARLLPARAAA